ncbi:hypothetical protein IGB42_01241 [Andreprevotia sp. IGB-42]|uniref:hypothetical protein n=1 Tax=Andreprevotia sp. IGB-42 TaxID=2497473 RepID=UPI00157F7659|nr:hypothetical protein [Andreprevotia sp. IGB-42]KAF0814340.1 hypothetical protein IGB42_01241 [Andreprevotia sp. IGB-42]
MLKLIVVYIHLLTTCIALAAVLKADRRLWHWREKALDGPRLAYIRTTQGTASFTLGILWITGAALIALGCIQDGMHYLDNPKLWMKVTVVIALTANGWLLHSVAFPHLQRRIAFVDLPLPDRAKLAVMGGVSATCWLFAAFLGIARSWNQVLPYSQILLIFASLLSLATCGALLVAVVIGRKANVEWLSQGETASGGI